MSFKDNLKKPRPQKPVDPVKEETVAAKGDDPVPAAKAEPKAPKKAAPKKAAKETVKDFLVPMRESDHARLTDQAKRLSDESYGKVSMRQLAARLLAEGLDRLEKNQDK